MIQKFHTSWIPELWLNPCVGHPPALWYSDMAHMATRSTIPMAPTAVLIRNRRLSSICLIACWRMSCSRSAGAFESMFVSLRRGSETSQPPSR
jgi:hypothetical protein